MNQEINLLTDLQARNRLARRNLWRLLICSLILAFVVLIIWVWLWSSSIVLKRQDAVLSANNDSLQTQIKSQTQIEQRQILLADRLNSVGSILAKRPKLAERLKKITALFPPEIKIESVELSEAGLLNLKFSTVTYAGLVRSLQILQTTDALSAVSLQEARRNSVGTYELTLEIVDK